MSSAAVFPVPHAEGSNHAQQQLQQPAAVAAEDGSVHYKQPHEQQACALLWSDSSVVELRAPPSADAGGGGGRPPGAAGGHSSTPHGRVNRVGSSIASYSYSAASTATVGSSGASGNAAAPGVMAPPSPTAAAAAGYPSQPPPSAVQLAPSPTAALRVAAASPRKPVARKPSRLSLWSSGQQQQQPKLCVQSPPPRAPNSNKEPIVDVAIVAAEAWPESPSPSASTRLLLPSAPFPTSGGGGGGTATAVAVASAVAAAASTAPAAFVVPEETEAGRGAATLTALSSEGGTTVTSFVAEVADGVFQAGPAAPVPDGDNDARSAAAAAAGGGGGGAAAAAGGSSSSVVPSSQPPTPLPAPQQAGSGPAGAANADAVTVAAAAAVTAEPAAVAASNGSSSTATATASCAAATAADPSNGSQQQLDRPSSSDMCLVCPAAAGAPAAPAATSGQQQQLSCQPVAAPAAAPAAQQQPGQQQPQPQRLTLTIAAAAVSSSASIDAGAAATPLAAAPTAGAAAAAVSASSKRRSGGGAACYGVLLPPRPLPPSGVLHLSKAAPAAMLQPVLRAASGDWGLSNFEVVRNIYDGYASSVYKAECLHSGEEVVLKVYKLRGQSAFLRYQMLRELDIHSRLQAHAALVPLYGAFRDGDVLVMVQEYMRGGSLARVRKELGGRMSEFQVLHLVLYPLLTALAHLHAHGIVHRDIKPANLLFSSDWQLKLCDFGVSICLHEERAVTRTGSKDYMAPEVVECPLKGRPEDNKDSPQLGYTPAVDVWSLGVLMYELLVGFVPFPCGPPRACRAGCATAAAGAAATAAGETESDGSSGSSEPADELRFPTSVSEPARAFVRACLRLHPGDRPTVRQLRQHEWVTKALEDVTA
ncbi:hypothetical protein HXX76_002047 [Chlamydomonas incerta]|uniref:Protein kinase domain-containing protein n=1 Tax=Chlamydomonas incerta TaxID=51695 RepID=A0A835WAB8_CHLIN|nr:hypothetical protein HXX76_002047 [Chlamydomonas incerta]|eukprot:KAG2443699.1 hypothetical protein HXX76_002047 [Chlamydomonas incerta]